MDRPGPRDPTLTPYVIDFERAFDDPRYSTVALVCGSQMGKSETVLDVLGHRFDQRPTPALYVGPSQDFITDEIEPRVMDLINNAPTLQQKIARGKKNKRFRKVIGGVPLKFAWAGSATQLSGTTAGLVIVDEYDRMMANVKGEGDPLVLTKARGFTFRDRKYGVTSTPLRGNVDLDKDAKSGLEFWKRMPPEDIESPVWKLFQSGTMYHFAWPCPECSDYFIPRFKQLVIDDKWSAADALEHAHVQCPRCGGVIEEHHKPEMNARGVYVAPGQIVKPDGTVLGDPPKSPTISFWASGLCSPFVTFGERASAYVEAKHAGDQEKLQGVINTGFGELWAPGGGDAPEATELMRLRHPYKLGDLPAGLVHLTAGVDVQKNRLIYSIRGWGARATSWLVQRGELYGETHQEEVWEDLADLLQTPIHGALIRLALVDSGFRPGKAFAVPVNRVYEFCRRHSRIARPSKGRATQSMPVKRSKIEVTPKGAPRKYSLELMLIDTDWAKSFVHEHIRYPTDALGAWLLPEDIDEGYCAQIVSESRIKRPSGRAQWIARSRENHFLDCEALNAAAGHLLNVQRIKEGRGLRETVSSDLGDAVPLEDEIVSVATVEPPPVQVPSAENMPPPSRSRSAPVAQQRRLSWAELSALLNK
jgi:phage terminase large subunit GpA-like protein